MISTRTKNLKTIKWCLFILSNVLTFGPFLAYSIIALYNSTTTTQKVALMSFLSFGVIVSLVGIMNKHTPRCVIWIVLIGIYVCLDHFLSCIIVMATTQCLDELVITPLYKHYKSLYKTNKEIDKRMPENG